MKAAAGVAAGLLPLLMNTSVAAAPAQASWYDQFAGQLTFRTTAGEEVTCPYEGNSSLTFTEGQDSLRATASTDVPSEDPRCVAEVSLILPYYDTHGDFRLATVFAPQRVGWASDGVGFGQDMFRAHHAIMFQACDASIDQNICNFGFVTQPK